MLDAYFARVGYSGPTAPTLATLTAIHAAHAASIPFENLDVCMSRPISLEAAAIFDKLVTRRRGGYCFEQNALLADVLETLGFKVVRLGGRVLLGSLARPRTHMLLRVTIDDRPYLADVGFGAYTLVEPIPLETGREVEVHGDRLRLIDEGLERTRLEGVTEQGWGPFYRFDSSEQLPIDYEMANWFTSTHPHSHFKSSNIVTLSSRTRRARLLDRTLTVRQDGETTQRVLASVEELKFVLRELFGIRLDDDAKLPF